MSGRGARAIDEHVDAADGGPPEHRFHPQAPHRFQGQGPLQEVTAHWIDGSGAAPDHWHLVTRGLTELTVKESDDPDVSGWGFELTFRLPGRDEPLWAVDLLTNLAAYVWSSGHPFAAGHHLDLGGPIRLDSASSLTAAVVVADPGLDDLDGPFGVVEFLQITGITADELESCRAWSTDGLIRVLAGTNPLLVTDIGRPSVLADPRVRREVEDGAQREGSSLTELRVATLAWRRRPGRGVVVHLGAGAAAALGPALRRELIGDGAVFRVEGDAGELHLAVGSPGWEIADNVLRVQVPLDQVPALADLFDGRTGWGRLGDLARLRFHVVP